MPAASEATLGTSVASSGASSGSLARSTIIDLGYGVRLVVFTAWRIAAMAARSSMGCQQAAT